MNPTSNSIGLAVDNDFNIYTLDYTLKALQKWLPDAKKPINLFEGRFENTPIFYHSLSSSLYLFYVLKENPGVYKLIDESTRPVSAINVNGKGSALNQLGISCAGLYVTSANDIFVVDTNNHRVVKWLMNGTSGILVADLNRQGSDSNQLSYPSGLYVDEMNNILYVVDRSNNRILKYTNESTSGMTAFGGGPHTPFSDVRSEYVQPLSVLVDKMGNILIGEPSRITKWTPDIKSNMIIFPQDKDSSMYTGNMNIRPTIMTFDKLENLYVYESGTNQVVKFIRNSTSCMNNSH